MILLPNESGYIMSEDAGVYFSGNNYQKMVYKMFLPMHPFLTFTLETHGLGISEELENVLNSRRISKVPIKFEISPEMTTSVDETYVKKSPGIYTTHAMGH
ncbi:hypothetical protein AV530_002531 [Patagioenas fasciata monilis]|uniref:Uncharacterized protein n=1 Tax=Patagioenas fasciata monilis TaxID=372326 RepID=A0A1V4K6Y6_PATFA|nr:hypothetical protein AV530_002531 [Patagioenas fasciata monilis]